jgi:hypothetical protein
VVTSLTVNPTNQPQTLQVPEPPPNYRQYLRKVGLLVYGSPTQGPNPNGTPLGSATGIDLSNMRITFQVRQFDYNVPNTAVIRVYNLSDATALKVQKEFQNVVLQAGYEGGNYGVIFQGTIKQFKKGRLDSITTFLEMYCSDGDAAWNFAPINTSMARGATFNQQISTMNQALKPFLPNTPDGQIQTAKIPDDAGTGGLTQPRGRVLFGMAAAKMNDVALSTNTTFKIVNGQVIFTTMSKYDAGDIIDLNVRTGLVLVPEATDNGVEVTALLNPAIRCGRRVHINNKDINTSTLTQAGQQVQPTILAFPASVTVDGFYRVIVADHEGDSRGGAGWFTRMTCLALTSQTGTVTQGG